MNTVRADVALRAARAEDLPAVLTLLEAARLPAEGVAEWLAHFVVAESAGRLVGVAGLEVYGPYALLRSVAVADDWRGRGVGASLTDALLSGAVQDGIRAVYLLTDTAEHYFPRHGFRRVERTEVPEAVRGSVEFRELCPASSTVMAKTISPST